jgi:hypothetical protein
LIAAKPTVPGSIALAAAALTNAIEARSLKTGSAA